MINSNHISFFARVSSAIIYAVAENLESHSQGWWRVVDGCCCRAVRGLREEGVGEVGGAGQGVEEELDGARRCCHGGKEKEVSAQDL